MHLDVGCLALAERRRAFLRAFRVRGPLDLTVLREHVEQQVGVSGTPSTNDSQGASPARHEGRSKPMSTR